MDERSEVLGFEPQQETIYNKFVPYADVLDQESNEQLSEIKAQLGRTIQFRDIKVGASHWTGQLAKLVSVCLLRSLIHTVFLSQTTSTTAILFDEGLASQIPQQEHLPVWSRASEMLWSVCVCVCVFVCFYDPVLNVNFHVDRLTKLQLFSCTTREIGFFRYIRLYGFKFSKEDHISLIKIVFDLLTIPDLDYTLVQKFASLLSSLLKYDKLPFASELVKI